ncbi:MAG: carbohydrate binding family 9 domain-containing protein, partial [bacterium]|nr:carbohydrate binding family 9 domain-containing protein [bacterium]
MQRPFKQIEALNLISILFVLFLMVLAPSDLFARRIPQVSGPITVDGRIGANEWSGVRPMRLIQLEPVPGANPSEQSEVFLAHDGEYLYAAARFYDSEPSLIRANGLQRDEMSGDDLFGLILDSFNDDESALAFYTNPAGTRIDTAISNDGEWRGTSPLNRNWNTFWESAASRDDEGWQAEMKIPFSSLRFREVDGRVVMGVLTWRMIARKAETVVYPAVDPKWHAGHLKPSLAEDMELEGVKSKRQLLVTPYVLGNVSQQTETLGGTQSLSASSTSLGYQVLESRDSQIGADFKWGITSDLTLDLTVNTDFAQVEADDAVVN